MANADVVILRDLARQYLEITRKPVYDQRRKLWTAHNSLDKTEPPIFLENYGCWLAWCREYFADNTMRCVDPFYREHERQLRIFIFQDGLGHDGVLEPWLTQWAEHMVHPNGPWGMRPTVQRPDTHAGATKEIPPLRDWADMSKLVIPHHRIDAAKTAELVRRVEDAVGDILPIDVDRAPARITRRLIIAANCRRRPPTISAGNAVISGVMARRRNSRSCRRRCTRSSFSNTSCQSWPNSD